MKKWLVLDVSYLCHRAFHTTRDLSFKGKATGIIFGFFRTIVDLKDEFDTDRIAFCFEHKHLFRRDIYPPYKARRHRRELPPEEKEAYLGLNIQIKELQKRYLPRIGFKNIFSFNGMESDDIMAMLAHHCPDDEEVILVTADSDLFQCLGPNVSIYSPAKKQLLTEEWFINRYGIHPRQWALVKAIAGCSSDEVEGIKGIGEVTALKYIRDEILPTAKAYEAILSPQARAIVRRNRKIVELPFEGCPKPDLVEDQIDREGWKHVCGLLGMKSLAGRPPIATMKLGKK